VGVFILGEVALGNTKEEKQPTHSSTLPVDKHSTHAIGT
jgi:hypothetical protein